MLRVFHADRDEVSSTLPLVAYVNKGGHSRLKIIICGHFCRSLRRNVLACWAKTYIDPERQAPSPRTPWSMATYFQRYLG